MKVLEAAKESGRLSRLIRAAKPSGFAISVHYHYYAPMFSVWAEGTDNKQAPMFDSHSELVENKGYTGDIEEARQALKQYLETEV